MPARIDALLRGPHLRLPRPLDAVSERWSRLRPRVRALVVAAAVAMTGAAVDAHVRSLQSAWGGPAVDVVVTTRSLAVGDALEGLRTVAVPPPLAPPDAVTPAQARGVVSLPVPAGAVVTRAHLDPRGPAAGLPAGLRAVPVPSEAGWGVQAGGWVDVWTLGGGEEPSALVAQGRPVLDVIEDPGGLTSLVGLSASEAEAVTAGLAVGRVLLAHAPPPASR
ncbi:MAG TPA: hypothetical protein VM287_09660 [Egibacteraceae bacterium]|nr:hypothetical protein [Egibacteraceae bacterium]HVM14584.1 hypothetical protein [Egibacteraceae bacterium]HVM19043.1 hypothetical protein [Egibacteraceae bacterium]